MDNFDLKKYLVENKVTTNSKMVNETYFKTATEYLEAAARDLYKIDLNSPDALEIMKAVQGPNPADALVWMQMHDPEVGGINELELEEYANETNIEFETVAEYQYEEESYDFSANYGAGEYDSALVIERPVTKDGKPTKIKGYDYMVSTDRGPMGGEFWLINEPYLKILKSMADIYDVDFGWYAGYKGRTKNK